MAPPPPGPLIHGSTTPIAKDVATAASTASPPAARMAAPTSAARRCCAATIPPEDETAAFRTIWLLEKLSMAAPLGGSASGRASLRRLQYRWQVVLQRRIAVPAHARQPPRCRARNCVFGMLAYPNAGQSGHWPIVSAARLVVILGAFRAS